MYERHVIDSLSLQCAETIVEPNSLRRKLQYVKLPRHYLLTLNIYIG
ncbi:MAG: hypothetical protein QXY40_02820 [Candidatus Methanomethylicia archaeon]